MGVESDRIVNRMHLIFRVEVRGDILMVGKWHNIFFIKQNVLLRFKVREVT